MHIVFYEVLYLRQTNILCYEVFECDDMKTTAALFFKKVILKTSQKVYEVTLFHL